MGFDIYDFYKHCASYFTVNGDKTRVDQEPVQEPVEERTWSQTKPDYKRSRSRVTVDYSDISIGDIWKEKNMNPEDPFSIHHGDEIEILNISTNHVQYVYKTMLGKVVNSKIDPSSTEISWLRKRYTKIRSGNVQQNRGWDSDFEVGDTLIEKKDSSSAIEIVDINGNIFSYVHSMIYGTPNHSGNVYTIMKSDINRLYKK